MFSRIVFVGLVSSFCLVGEAQTPQERTVLHLASCTNESRQSPIEMASLSIVLEESGDVDKVVGFYVREPWHRNSYGFVSGRRESEKIDTPVRWPHVSEDKKSIVIRMSGQYERVVIDGWGIDYLRGRYADLVIAREKIMITRADATRKPIVLTRWESGCTFGNFDDLLKRFEK